jgi:zinc protease
VSARAALQFRAGLFAALALLVCAAALGTALVPARAETPLHFPAVHAAKLANGLRVFVVEHHELPLVSVRVVVEGAGEVADPAGKEGLADLVAETLTLGGGGMGAEAYADAVAALGASMGAAANVDEAYLAGTGAAPDLDALLDLSARAVLTPSFEGGEVKRAVRKRIADLEERMDRPGMLASDALLRWVFPSHPYGHPIGGTIAGIKACSRADAQRLHRMRYGPAAAFVVVAGDVSAAAGRAAVERRFGAWAPAKEFVPPLAPPSPAPPPDGRTLFIVDSRDTSQVNLKLAVPGPSRRAAEGRYPALMLASAMLAGGFTSRLVDRLRVDLGLVYSVDSGFEMNVAGGYFDVSTATDLDTARKLVDETMAVLADFIKTGPTTEELDGAKAYLGGGFPLGYQTADGLAAAVHDRVVFGLPDDWDERYLPALRATNAAAVRSALAELLAPGRVGLVVVGPADKIRKAFEGWAPRTVVRPRDDI